MPAQPFPHARSPYRPANNTACLCGSGQQFGQCCSDHLPGFEIGKKARAAADTGDWPSALAAARADVTQYSIWHATNTAPLLRSDPQAAERLKEILQIDIDALSDYVDLMRTYSCETGARDGIPATLERLRGNIDHDRWRRRILYLHCLHALGEDWDEDAARVEFKKLGSMAEESDIEILQLYIDLFGRQIGIAELLSTTDRIISLATDEGVLLHYRSLKAVTYLAVDDVDGAMRELLNAIELFRKNPDKGNRSLYTRNHFASALCHAGCISGRVELLDEAASELELLLSDPSWTPSGKASLLRLRADIHRLKGEWQNARNTYLDASNLERLSIHQVFIAQATLFIDGPAQSVVAINAVDIAGLDAEEYVDYAIALAHIAIESGDQRLLASAEVILRKLPVAAPYFKKQCDALLVSVIDTSRAGPAAERNRTVRQLLASILPNVTRYIKLEPNFMGIGINLGKLIDDLSERNMPPTDKS